MSSKLAGRLTIFDSAAGLIVAGQAKRESTAMPFWEYSKAGLPLRALTLGPAVAWLRSYPFASA
jgi:Na+/H+ antiporter NhaD/arsenite permease-like protein